MLRTAVPLGTIPWPCIAPGAQRPRTPVRNLGAALSFCDPELSMSKRNSLAPLLCLQLLSTISLNSKVHSNLFHLKKEESPSRPPFPRKGCTPLRLSLPQHSAPGPSPGRPLSGCHVDESSPCTAVPSKDLETAPGIAALEDPLPSGSQAQLSAPLAPPPHSKASLLPESSVLCFSGVLLRPSSSPPSPHPPFHGFHHHLFAD